MLYNYYVHNPSNHCEHQTLGIINPAWMIRALVHSLTYEDTHIQCDGLLKMLTLLCIWVCVHPCVLYVCTYSIESVCVCAYVCVSICIVVQDFSLSGMTRVSYLLKLSLVKAFKANCVDACALMFSVLCFSAASFSCVYVFRSFSKCYSLGEEWDALSSFKC